MVDPFFSQYKTFICLAERLKILPQPDFSLFFIEKYFFQKNIAIIGWKTWTGEERQKQRRRSTILPVNDFHPFMTLFVLNFFFFLYR